MLTCFLLSDMGGGDVKLLAAVGAFLGLQHGLTALLWTIVLGGVTGLAMLIWQVGAGRILVGTARHLALVVRSRGWVPLETAERSRFVVFREPDGLREHIAILIGDDTQWADPVPVRLHSACLTGDLFGSLRCDCGPQLQESLARISTAGRGVLVLLTSVWSLYRDSQLAASN